MLSISASIRSSEFLLPPHSEKYFTESVMKELELAVAKEFKYGSTVVDETYDMEDKDGEV